MLISELIEHLEDIRAEQGEIETTCEVLGVQGNEAFETTIEHFDVHEHPTIGKCVKVLM